jgi:hypothetical protein
MLVRLTARFSSPPDWAKYCILAHAGVYPVRVSPGRADAGARILAFHFPGVSEAQPAAAALRKMGATVRTKRTL